MVYRASQLTPRRHRGLRAMRRKGSTRIQSPPPRGRLLGQPSKGQDNRTSARREAGSSPSQANDETLEGVNLGEGLPATSQQWLLKGIPAEVSQQPRSHPRTMGPSGPGISLSESSPGDWMGTRVGTHGTTFSRKLLAHFPSPLSLQEPSLCLLRPREQPQALKY